MSFSISRASRETGVSKSTISRAIKAGRVSARRQDDGSYLIEPAELFRVWPRVVTQPPQPASEPRHDAPRNPLEQAPATPSPDAEILRVRLEMTETMLAKSEEAVADLRKRLDLATDRVLMLTRVAQPPDNPVHDAPRNPLQPSERRGFWGWWRWR